MATKKRQKPSKSDFLNRSCVPADPVQTFPWNKYRVQQFLSRSRFTSAKILAARKTAFSKQQPPQSVRIHDAFAYASFANDLINSREAKGLFGQRFLFSLLGLVLPFDCSIFEACIF